MGAAARLMRKGYEMFSLDDWLAKLRAENDRLVDLLAQPEPGLGTWVVALATVLRDLTETIEELP